MQDENGLGCVSIAIYHHEPEIARLLIESGAPVTFFEHCALGDIIEVQERTPAEPGFVGSILCGWFPGIRISRILRTG